MVAAMTGRRFGMAFVALVQYPRAGPVSDVPIAFLLGSP